MVAENPALDMNRCGDALHFFLHVRRHGNAKRGECAHALSRLHGLHGNRKRPLRALLSKRPNGDRVDRLACQILEGLAGEDRDRRRRYTARCVPEQKLVMIRHAFGFSQFPAQGLIEKTDRLAIASHDMFMKKFSARAELGQAFGETRTHGADFQFRYSPVVILPRLENEAGSETEQGSA